MNIFKYQSIRLIVYFLVFLLQMNSNSFAGSCIRETALRAMYDANFRIYKQIVFNNYMANRHNIQIEIDDGRVLTPDLVYDYLKSDQLDLSSAIKLIQGKVPREETLFFARYLRKHLLRHFAGKFDLPEKTATRRALVEMISEDLGFNNQLHTLDDISIEELNELIEISERYRKSTSLPDVDPRIIVNPRMQALSKSAANKFESEPDSVLDHIVSGEFRDRSGEPILKSGKHTMDASFLGFAWDHAKQGRIRAISYSPAVPASMVFGRDVLTKSAWANSLAVYKNGEGLPGMKTYFPESWQPKKIKSKILEALDSDELRVVGARNPDDPSKGLTVLEARVTYTIYAGRETRENLYIKLLFYNGELKSAFPSWNQVRPFNATEAMEELNYYTRLAQIHLRQIGFEGKLEEAISIASGKKDVDEALLTVMDPKKIPQNQSLLELVQRVRLARTYLSWF